MNRNISKHTKETQNIKSHGRTVKSLKEKYRRLDMQIIRISDKGKRTDGGERIIKPTIDKMLSELKKHLSYRLKRFATSQKGLIKKKHIFICTPVNYSEFLK